MPIWPVASVEEQPHLTLRHWRVMETELRERHFVGYCLENREGRVSSAIVSFDATTRTGITRSGRRYVLADGPGVDGDAEYVWNFWASYNHVTEAKDVTAEYIPPSEHAS